MTDSIKFPSASNMSKLSACPTTKLPQATDWIFQDFFDTMLNGDDLLTPSTQIAELFPQEKLTEATFNLLQSTFSDDCYEEWHNNNKNTCTTMTDDQLSLPDLEDNSKNSSNISSSDEEEEEEQVDDQDITRMKDHNNSVTFQSDLTELSNVAPVLIESTISSCTTMSSEDAMSFRQSIDTNNISLNQTLAKRKSTSSFSSLKSFMSVFHTNKKSKLTHYYSSTPCTSSTVMVLGGHQQKSSSMTSSFSRKFLKYFKRRS
ncbi:hypothetical protein INT46_007165 [Mucor plumbeus]|uniref:Uncharacterized protein n=1 Tax=Mucor plumbeus TaxID=97098 RepID=A0A8H7R932_9FUNG|nr:hypothetical protein INT46_007165 [Mucor plumbeus]